MMEADKAWEQIAISLEPYAASEAACGDAMLSSAL